MKKLLLFLLALSLLPALAAAQDPKPLFSMENDGATQVADQKNDANVGVWDWATAQKTDGAVSMHFNAKTTGGWTYGLTVTNAAALDVSSYDYINLDIYGDNCGQTLYFDLYGNNGAAAFVLIPINWTGWKTIQIPRATGFSDGSGGAKDPQLTFQSLVGVQIWANAGGPMNIYLDKVVATNTKLAPTQDPQPLFSMENDGATQVADQKNDANVGVWDWATAQKTDGAVSMHFNAKTTGGWTYGLTVTNAAALDVSSYAYINLDIYGDNCGQTLYFDLYGNNGAAAYINIPINFTGWKTIQIPRATGFTDGSGGAKDPQLTFQGLVGVQIWANAGGPMNIYLDKIVATNTKLATPDNAVVCNAGHKTITVDGNVADWANLTASQPTHIDVSARGANYKLAADVRYAWDADYLYVLIQEAGASTTKQEGPAGDYSGAPWSYDGLSLWVDLNNSNTPAYGFNPWFGFNSDGATNSWTARVNNNDAVLLGDPLANGNCATSGSFAQHNRTIEARIKWSDLAATVDPARQPGGDLLAAIKPGYRFGSNPLLVENNWNGQSFIGGVQYAAPSGDTPDSRDIILVDSVPVELSGFSAE